MYPNATLEDLRKAFTDSLYKWKIKGGSEPLDPNNRKVNRRTEIIVLE